uniref:polynucleotide adenylyltransferase PcnB n=1 Tax=Chitinasiproducens palmae TaxID=1770053 RepID=UPI0038B3EF73
MDARLISRNAVRVTDTLQQAGYRAFIVGGAVRDLLLGVAPKDFDVATDATPEQVVKLFRRARLIGRRFQIVHVQFGPELIEVSTFRGLSNGLPSAELPAPESVDAIDAAAARVAPAEIEALAAARDAEADPADSDDDAQEPAGTSTDTITDTITDTERDGGDGGEGRGRRRRRRRDDTIGPHAVDASGRVLRDNVWGEQHEDARRRDLTINAMYYDPATQTVLDYHDGLADAKRGVLRMIGEPLTRYREDPVRMLRVVRFGAKLDFDVDPATRAPIAELRGLLSDVPAARLFDESLKLLLSGHARASIDRLRTEGLDAALLPTLAETLADPVGERFLTLVLTRTDERIASGRTVSPSFLFAALLWLPVLRAWHGYVAAGELPVPALHRAMDQVLDEQLRKLAIHRRFTGDMKEIWGLQQRLEKRPGRSALKLLEHQKFRAAYDFLLLRAEAGEIDAAVAQWWTDFIEGDLGAREALLANTGGAREKSRRRRRGGARRRPAGEGGPNADGGGAEHRSNDGPSSSGGE